MYVHRRQFSSTKQFLFVIGTTLHTTQGIIAIICILLKRNVSSCFSKPLDKRYLLTKKQIQRTWNNSTRSLHNASVHNVHNQLSSAWLLFYFFLVEFLVFFNLSIFLWDSRSILFIWRWYIWSNSI